MQCGEEVGCSVGRKWEIVETSITDKMGEPLDARGGRKSFINMGCGFDSLASSLAGPSIES